MDLAKIRQKAKQFQEQQLVDEPQPSLSQTLTVGAAYRAVSDETGAGMPVQAPAGSVYQQDPTGTQEFSFSQRPAQRSPLEIILAGRELAGCDEEQYQATTDQEQTALETYHEFLCFRVSNELYGINIMDIKELIKPREVTEVPRAPSFVTGVISLRGTIIPIIDMLVRLGLEHGTVTGRERVIVVRHGESFSGLLVDEIIQVVRIAQECLENTPSVLDGIDRDFVSGIGRTDGKMIILLNLMHIVDINLY